MIQDVDRSDRARYGTVHDARGRFPVAVRTPAAPPGGAGLGRVDQSRAASAMAGAGRNRADMGGRVYLAFTDGDGVIDGRVTAIAPPRLLEFTWTDKGDDFGFVRWELTAEDGGTRLVLTHTVPASARESGLPMLAGWHSLLDQLAALLDGQPCPSRGRWQELHDHYARAGVMGARPETEGNSGAMTQHMTGTRDEWLAARLDLLEAEKELTRRGDEVARRRELPWVRIDKEYRFDTDDGSASLADLFRGRSQLLVYHFMFGPDYTAGCPSCSMIADAFDGFSVHLANHDVISGRCRGRRSRSCRHTSGAWAGRFPGRLRSAATSISISTPRSPARNCATGPNTTTAATIPGCTSRRTGAADSAATLASRP